jgi:hypothetical protein
MDLPTQAPHFFTSVALNAIPEIEYALLVEVSQLATSNSQNSSYSHIRYALQKLQWVKMACLRAKHIDDELTKIEVDDSLLMDPTGQAEHSRAVFEIMAYGKAVLDALSHFLNYRWALGMKEQTSDFKWQVFRDEVSKISPQIDGFLKSEISWLDKDSRKSDSLPAARDEWIHRGAPEIPLAWPPTDVGVLPVPKSLDTKPGSSSISANQENFFSTDQFVEKHWGNLVTLTKLVLHEAILVERDSQPNKEIVDSVGPPVSFFPTLITVEKQWSKMSIGPFTK